MTSRGKQGNEMKGERMSKGRKNREDGQKLKLDIF
jgi:hypothetical protein